MKIIRKYTSQICTTIFIIMILIIYGIHDKIEYKT